MRKLTVQETASFRRPASVRELGREPIAIEYVLVTGRAWIDDVARPGRMVYAATVSSWCRRII